MVKYLFKTFGLLCLMQGCLTNQNSSRREGDRDSGNELGDLAPDLTIKRVENLNEVILKKEEDLDAAEAADQPAGSSNPKEQEKTELKARIAQLTAEIAQLRNERTAFLAKEDSLYFTLIDPSRITDLSREQAQPVENRNKNKEYPKRYRRLPWRKHTRQS